MQPQKNFNFAVPPQVYDIKLEDIQIEFERGFFFDLIEKYFQPNNFEIFKQNYPRRERFLRCGTINFKNPENYFSEVVLEEIEEKFGSLKNLLLDCYQEAWNLARLKTKHQEIMTGIKGIFKPIKDYKEVEVWHSGSKPGCCKEGKHKYTLKNLPQLPLPGCKRNGVYCQCQHNVILDNEITRSIHKSA